MKPTKNSYYCPECRRTKMLFASEVHALNFIKFNSATIQNLNRKAPVRAYFCEACAGWHLTSWETYTHTESKTEQVTNQYRTMQKELQQQELSSSMEHYISMYKEIPILFKEKGCKTTLHQLYKVIKGVKNCINNKEIVIPKRIQILFIKILTEADKVADVLLSNMRDNIQLMYAHTSDAPMLISQRMEFAKEVNKFARLGEKYYPLYNKYSNIYC